MKKMIEKASPSLMDAVIVYSCGGFTSLDKAAEIEAFFKVAASYRVFWGPRLARLPS